ncbi:MAG: hypothetical protein L6R42_003991 [Xanthoria sp. 1 TBL-2021]|nr:MAG: hypothetical protein L6R42_003991 [Xanthoria sp. 1 TBL-2021]
MPNIYTSAKGVIVWLGPESDDTAIAMNAIQDLGSRVTVDWDLRTMAPASESHFDPDSEKSYDAVEPSPQVWRSIHNLLGRAWFERLWIIQEVCLAGKNTHVVCGSVEISYEHFGNGICYLTNWKGVDEPQIQRLWELLEQLLVLSNKTTFSQLDWVLAQTRQSQCSDQRDRVYAILSLVPEKERLEIRPDYTLSAPEVFQRVVLQQARCRSQLNVLRFCSMNSGIMDLPTWVPDWSVGSSVESLRRLRADAAAKAYPCFESEGILAAMGLCITVVDNIKKDFTDRIPRTRYASAKGIGELISAVVGGETNNRRTDKLHSLCRTLCTAEFREMSTPDNPEFPLLEESLKYIMDCDDWLRQNSTKPPRPHSSYMVYVNGFSSGRVLVTSADGRLGLAPRATKPGDKICVILGCSSPLVLRSDDNGFTHKVVGECYLDGIMTGEALLGELPKKWMMLQKYYPEYHVNYWLFLDGNTGQTRVDDPRLGPLPAGWRFKSHEEEDAWNRFVNDGTGEDTMFDPRLEPDLLKARGVELQEFRLI